MHQLGRAVNWVTVARSRSYRDYDITFTHRYAVATTSIRDKRGLTLDPSESASGAQRHVRQAVGGPGADARNVLGARGEIRGRRGRA